MFSFINKENIIAAGAGAGLVGAAWFITTQVKKGKEKKLREEVMASVGPEMANTMTGFFQNIAGDFSEAFNASSEEA